MEVHMIQISVLKYLVERGPGRTEIELACHTRR